MNKHYGVHTMTSSLRLGQFLRGRNGIYTITKQLQGTVWIAKYEAPSIQGQDSIYSRGRDQPVIVKSVHHFRLQNERDVLKRFQSCTPFIRPLIDEIVEPADPPAIVLKYLDDHLLHASVSQKPTNQEIKYIARRILEAVRVLHDHNFVHTGKAVFIHGYISNTYLLCRH